MTAFVTHVMRGLRERLATRRDWLILAWSLPASARLSWDAAIMGRCIGIGAGTSIGAGAALHAGRTPPACIDIGPHCRIGSGARLMTWGGSITIGEHSSVNAHSLLYGTGGIRIGRYVRIAADTTIVASQHVFSSTQDYIASQGFTSRGIVINDDVWIGAGVCVLDGVTIGTGSIVGAGAVVTKDVEPFTVVAGVPAVVIRTRTPPRVADRA
jgi:acetyltransferase-like isoleucine patch superfamily enzyme